MKKLIVVIIYIGFLSISNAQWVQANGPYSTWISSLISDGTTIYAGTRSGEVYISMDNGENWNTISPYSLTTSYIDCFAREGSTLYIGTRGDGILSTSDNGQNWIKLNNGLTNLQVYALSLNNSIIYAGTSGGVFYSADNGNSWVAINNGLSNLNVLCLATSGSNIFAGTNGGGIFLSTNNGSSWNSVNMGLTQLWIYSIVIDGANIFAGESSDGVFLSTNNGSAWSPVKTNLSNSSKLINQLILDGSNLIAATWGGVYLSTNSGISWSNISSGIPPGVIWAITSNGSAIIAGTDFGNYRTLNHGSSWTESNKGIYEDYTYAMTTIGISIYAGTNNGVYSTSNNGANWKLTNVNTDNGMINLIIYSLISNSSDLFAGSWGRGICKSSDGGLSWKYINSGLTNLFLQTNSIKSIGNNIFAGTWGGGVFRISSNDTVWTSINTGLPNTYINSLAVIGSNLYAAPSNGGVYLSTDNGDSWTAVNSGLPSGVDIYNIISAGSTLFAAPGISGLYISKDNGKNWTYEYLDQGIAFFNAIVTDGSYFYAATTKGLYFSDNGKNWLSSNNGLPSSPLTSILINGSDLYIGVNNNGIWKRPISEIITNGNLINIDGYQTPGSITADSGQAVEVYARVYVKDAASFQSKLTAQLNIAQNGDPRFNPYKTFNASYNRQIGSDTLEYKAVVSNLPISDYSYCFSFLYLDKGYFVGNKSTNPSLFYSGFLSVKNSPNSSITFNDFSSAPNLNFRGTASTVQNVLRITGNGQYQVGQTWYNEKKQIAAGFTTNFTFNINTLVEGGADGFAFVIQNSSLATDATTFSKGYDLIPNSLVVEFDTYQNNELNDPNGNHISVHSLGTLVNSANESASLGIATNIPNLKDGNTHSVQIDYSSGILGITMDGNIVLSVNVILDQLLNLDNGTAWIGFTAATGAFTENHDILSWSYSSKLITDIKKQPDTGLPTEYNLSQNYPNPFNPITRVDYSLPREDFVSIRVYDMLGNNVTTLVNEYKSAGNYSVFFNASKLASGIYFYRIQAGSFTQTKKLILMK